MSGPNDPLEGDRVDFDDEVPAVCEVCGLRWCDCGWPGHWDLAVASASEASWWREVAA